MSGSMIKRILSKLLQRELLIPSQLISSLRNLMEKTRSGFFDGRPLIAAGVGHPIKFLFHFEFK